jgi:hypothetical protein
MDGEDYGLPYVMVQSPSKSGDVLWRKVWTEMSAKLPEMRWRNDNGGGEVLRRNDESKARRWRW